MARDPMQNALDEHAAAYEGNSPYDLDNGILMRWYARRVVELTRGARAVLELGLGHGFTAQVFAPEFEDYTILEGSAAVIAAFRRRCPGFRGRIVEGFFEDYAPPAPFDVVIMGFVLEHVEDPEGLLRRYGRLLGPGGRLFVAVPNAASMNRRLGHLAGLLPDLLQLSQHDLDLGHRRYFTTESLREAVERAGGEVVRMEGIYLKPLTTEQLRSLGLSPRIFEALCQLGTAYPELCCGLLAEVRFP